MREYCQTTQSGTTLLGLVEAARKVGFQANGASGEYEDLMKEKLPCIAHVILPDGLQHYLVVYKMNNKQIWLGDPGKGLYKIRKEAFLKMWKHRAVLLVQPKDKLLNQQPLHWSQWIYAYLRKQHAWIFQSVFLGVVFTALGLLTSLFVQWVLDRFIPEGNAFKVILTGGMLFLILLLRAFAGFLRQRFMIILNKRVSVHITHDFLAHLFRLPKRFFDLRKTGDITARINDSLKIHQAILLLTQSALIDGLIIVGSLAFMFYFSSTLALFSLGVIPVYTFILFSTSKKIKKQQNQVMKFHASVESTYINSIQGINEIIGFNSSHSFTRLNQAVFTGYQDAIETLGFTKSQLSFLAMVLNTLLTVFVLTFGALQVIQNRLLVGELMASYSLLANVIPSLLNLVSAYITIQGAHIAAQRLMDLLLVDQEKNHGKKRFELREQLEIQNGMFGFIKNKPIFSHLDITLPVGEIRSIWGPSGVGKTTLVHILQRKYTLEKGRILLDGIPCDHFDLHRWRQSIGVIPQDVNIFNGTLAENILIGRKISNVDELVDRLKKIGLDFYPNRFEYGLYSHLGEDGVKLSGGEKQLLAMARALFDEPRILIIDEGLSAIDQDTEHLIFTIIRKYKKYHAVLLISHRFETILKSDYVYFMTRNGVEKKGPTESLQGYHQKQTSGSCKV
jgi:ATP-binding cassette subfamily B protein